MWISLLLAGALSIPGGTSVLANSEAETTIQETDMIEEGLSGNISANEMDEVEFSEEEMDVYDTVSGQEDVEQEEVSENAIEKEPVLSDNSQSSNIVLDEKTESESENSTEAKETPEKIMDVILPTEIPFDMVLLGEERLKGVIRSRQFYMENRGFEDVRISMQGVCTRKGDQEYVISNTSVENEIVQGKKNIWMYLRWEDENGNELDQPGIIMGDDSNPGKGEIILKAPERNSKGEVEEGNSQSRVYFSIFGDINSDNGRIWEDAEFGLHLDWEMEEITSDDTVNSANLLEDGKSPKIYENKGETESISDNANVDILQKEESISENNSVSDNTVLSEGEKDISDADMPEEQKGISDNEHILDEQESVLDDFNVREQLDSISDNADEKGLTEQTYPM